MKVKLPGTSPYLAKDQRKSDQATKFIGHGSLKSSTEKYRRAWGERANCGQYNEDDFVFISAEGARTGRKPAHLTELEWACAARATIITDGPYDRNRSYNVGEREVAQFLSNYGYRDNGAGRWSPQN